MLRNAERKKLETVFAGVHRYLSSAGEGARTFTPPVWQRGTTRLLDYGGTGKPLLFIPSLINRYAILDLLPEHSLIAYFQALGYRCLIVDWDTPGAEESRFTGGDYVMHRLVPIADAVCSLTNQKPVVFGYCMGGLLALALAHHREKEITALGLLATPWDFHHPDMPFSYQDTALAGTLEALLSNKNPVSPTVINALFAMANPQAFERKFERFASMHSNDPESRLFCAIERWVSDGVPFSASLAQECMKCWWQENAPFRGQWRVGDIVIKPSTLKLPCYLAIPANDRIVPRGCAEALLHVLPHATCHVPSSGHVGMIAGMRAKTELWHPLAMWLEGVISS